jgi:hypothetical protein
MGRVNEVISGIKEDPGSYNSYVERYLPYQKRYGKILRKDFWDIFLEEKAHFGENLTPAMISILEKIVVQSTGGEPLPELESMTSGDFLRYCELGYDANSCFSKESKELSPKEKYLGMADGRDCGLRNVDESSAGAFSDWYAHESHCGGHPWEIFRGGNSTHISLYVNRTETGWQLTLAGSSRVRVVETVKMACALYQAEIPFILRESREILRMVTGTDYIGIVPETIFPRYCHSHFPKEDQIIDFMQLGSEFKTEIITKADWYSPEELKLLENL